MTIKTLRRLSKGLLGASAIALFTAGTASALGTAAGTNVSNTFTLSYDVAGTPQPSIDTGPSGSDTPTEFTVDRFIDLTVNNVSGATVAPGAQDQEMVFSVTNTGNDTQAYAFTLFNELDGTDDIFDTDSMTITFYVDDGDGTFEDGGGVGDDGAGTTYTPGSGDASSNLPADALIWVVVIGDIPTASGDPLVPGDTDTSVITLVADTLYPDDFVTVLLRGDEVVADVDGTNALTGDAENVLGDDTGTAREVANAGDHSAAGTFTVNSAEVTATKSVSIFKEDDTGCGTIPGTAGTDPFSVPGACVEYVITVVNNGATASATNIDIADTLPTDLEYRNSVVSATLTGGTFTQPSDGDDCDTDGCDITLDNATLAAGATGTITIRAVIK